MIYSFILVDKKSQRVVKQFRGSYYFANSMKKQIIDSILYVVSYPKEGEMFNPKNPVNLETVD